MENNQANDKKRKYFFVNPFEKQKENDPLLPKYTKPDGTQVFEIPENFGLRVLEKNLKKGLLIMRCYDKQDRLWLDYGRSGNFEVGHHYDEFGNMDYKYESVYDEHNVLAMKTEYDMDYYDNGVKKAEVVTTLDGHITMYYQYDKTGKRTEKIEERGTVKTYFDENDKPFKREIDRGSGGIITENL